MTRDELTHQRLASQQVGGKRSIRDLVSALGALQAQDYYCSLWAIGVRTGKTERKVIEATQRCEIVRTWSQRGTLHFVAAEDAKWMVDLSAPRRLASAKTRHRALGLDEKTWAKSRELFAAALSGGRRLSRPKIMEVLENAGISTEAQRGYHILFVAAQTGLIYMGPMDGKQQSFGLLEDLPVPMRELSGDDAIAELTRRYFTSHGPATVSDFAFWSGLTLTECRRGLETLASELVCEHYEGQEYWRGDSATKTAPATVLLPGFDEFILGYKDRSAQISAENFKRLAPGGNGVFLYSIVIDGQIAGLWKRTLKKDRVVIRLDPFQPLSKSQLAAVELAAQEYADFLGLKLEMA